MSEWQSIDTAPYNVPFMASNGRDILSPCFRAKAGEISEDEFVGWWQSEGNGFFVEINPTHWMPLPDPPK